MMATPHGSLPSNVYSVRVRRCVHVSGVREGREVTGCGNWADLDVRGRVSPRVLLTDGIL